MTAKDVYEYLLDHANKRRETTCDGLIAGDENKEVRRAATCFKLTTQVLAQAIESGIDMIITHEPTFSHGDLHADDTEIDRKKLDMLKQSGIVLYRFHDHAHDSEPDYIHAGFIQALDMKIKHKYPNECLGICRYELAEETTARQLASDVAEKLGVEFVRVVGKKDFPVKTVCLGLGSVGFTHINSLIDPGCDVFITGEVDEVLICEYIRDACYFGMDKAILLLGHCSAEYAGMRLLSETLNKTLLPTEYIHCGEVYT